MGPCYIKILWMLNQMFKSFPILFITILLSFAEIPTDIQAKSIFVESPFEHQSSKTYGIQLEGHAYASSNIQPVREVPNQWRGAFRKAPTEMLVLSEIYKGGRYQSFELGHVERMEIFVTGDSDFSEVYYRSRRGKDFTPGARYRAEGRMYGYELEGWRLGYAFQVKSLQFLVRGTHLTGKQSQDIDLKADIEAITPKIYSIEATATQRYTENLLYDQPLKNRFDGSGYSFDVYSALTLTPQWHTSLTIKDLGGKIRWKDLPYGEIEGTNKVVQTGTKVKPAVQGVERFETHDQTLITKISATGQYYFTPIDAKRWAVSGTLDTYVERWIPSVDLHYFRSDFQYSLGYNLHFQTLGIEIDHPCCFFRIESDHLDLGKSYTQGISGGVHLDF